MAFGADGKVSGTGGCNQYSAPYQTTGEHDRHRRYRSTLMLCEGAAGTQESVFLAALRAATAGGWTTTVTAPGRGRRDRRGPGDTGSDARDVTGGIGRRVW